MKNYNVVSFFDGMSVGRVALERAGIPVERYWAYEVDKYAIKISVKNHDDVYHLGDVRAWTCHKMKNKPDLFLA